MRRLRATILTASLLACSTHGSGGGLVLGVHTNDLVISGDVNLVGLYISHQDAKGTVREHLAYEATPLVDASGQVKVSFPSTLAVDSSGNEGESVHVRLVAYKGSSREVLTMREARTQVPTGDVRLLQLNLFFTNQNNVVDTKPGAGVLDASVVLQDQGGAISQDTFDRFQSMCNGAAAPTGMTAGDDGACVPLDVVLGDTDRFDDTTGIFGGRKEDPCYDVTAAFEQRNDGAIRIVDKPAAGTGACTLQLPATYDPARLNVALVTTEKAFPASADYQTLGDVSLRPLAAGPAFTQNGTSIVLPAGACDLARRPEVVGVAFSQRAARWTAAEPVCSAWSVAGAKSTSAGPPPDGGTDAGDLGIKEVVISTDLDDPQITSILLSTNSTYGVFGYSSAGNGIHLNTYTYDQTEPNAFFDTKLPGSTDPRLHAVTFTNTNNHDEFYLYRRSEESMQHVVLDANSNPSRLEDVVLKRSDGSTQKANGGILRLQTTSGGDVYINHLQVGSTLYEMDTETTATDTGASISLSGAEGFPTWPAEAFDDHAHQLGLILAFGAAAGQGGLQYVINPGATSVSPTTVTDTPREDFAGAGTTFFGIGITGTGTGPFLQHYGVPNTDAHTATEAVDVASNSLDLVCYVQTQSGGALRVLHCGGPTDLTTVSFAPFSGNIAQMALSGEGDRLHVAYRCADASGIPTGPYRAVRIAWAQLAALSADRPAALTRCAL